MATDCEINDGLLQPECLQGQAGIKTVFFFRHTNLDVVYNVDGEITSIGSGYLYRFDQDNNHGSALEELQQGQGEESSFIKQQIDMTMFYIDPEFRKVIDLIRKGRWAVFCLDYHDKIKLYGEMNAMKQVGGAIPSGTKSGDNLYSNLVFEGIQDEYAHFLEDFTTYPFDNMAGVEVMPRYDNAPGLILQNVGLDNILIDNFGNKLDYN